MLALPVPEDAAYQDKLPVPSVCSTYPELPPVILILALEPKLTLLAPVKFTVPVEVNPVSDPRLVILVWAAP